MKRMFILLSCFALLLTLAGCGEKPSSPAEAEPALSLSDMPVDDQPLDSEENEEDGAEMLWLGDVFLVDNGACSIRAARFITFPSGEGRLELVLENKLPDRSCTFSFFGLSVNSVLVSGDTGRFRLAPGERTVEYLPFAYTAPGRDSGIKHVADIEVRFSVQDALDETLEYAAHTVFHICPNVESVDNESSPSA